MSNLAFSFENLLKLAINDQLDDALFEANLTASSLSYETFCNEFALVVARRFLENGISYEDADAAINCLWGIVITDRTRALPELFYSIYEAFDAGEFRRTQDPDEDPVERYTRPSLNKILAAHSQ